MNYQRQTWQHDFEEKSELQLKEAFVSVGWRVQRLRHDYGEDLIGRQFEHGNPTGHDFYIQLKGTDKIEKYQLARSQVLSYSIELVNLKQWYSYTLPVIIIVWDITNRVGYWIHIQPFIEQQLKKKSNWLKNNSNACDPKRKIHVSMAQVIKENYLDSLKFTIEREWGKISRGKNHFEMLYKASEIQLGKELAVELSPVIERQVKITQSNAFVIANPGKLTGWLDLAVLHYDNSNFHESLKAINQACKIDNKDDRLVKQIKACILAEYAYRNCNPPSMLREAIDLFESASEEIDPLAKYNIGNCYSSLEEHEIAIEYFEQALSEELEPEQLAQIWNNRGRSMVKIGDLNAAILSFDKAFNYNPSLWNVYSSLAHIKTNMNDHKSACIHFEKAFQLNPHLEADGDSHLVCYAWSLCQVGRYIEALHSIDQLLFVYPFHKSGLDAKAQILARLRTEDSSFTQEALKFFEKRLLDEPLDMLARSELNFIYRDLGYEKERRMLIEETINLDNPPAKAFYDYAMLLEHDGFLTEAINYLEKAAAKEQNHAILHSLARIYKKNKNYDQAIEYYNLALINTCNPLIILSEISDCYYLLGDYKNDIVVITKALLLNADENYWWDNLLFALSQLGADLNNYLDFLSQLDFRNEDVTEKEIRIEINNFLEHPSRYSFHETGVYNQ